MVALVWFVFASVLAVTSGDGLRDNSIIGDNLLYLDGSWKLEGSGQLMASLSSHAR